MNRSKLYEQIVRKKTFLCVGLDPDIQRIPIHIRQDKDAVLRFCKTIIDHTQEHCVAYKPNIAFFESLGAKGWEILEQVLDYIPDSIFTIADAKRGDIGNTSRMYAKTFFQTYNFDAVTVAPYMGEDSVTPFLEFDDKWVILLAYTSNKGSNDFQLMSSQGERLFERVIVTSQQWGNPNNLMYVIGATHPEAFQSIRSLAKDHFFLVPGVGAQGGSLDSVAKAGMNDQCGLLVNSSRGIIYAGDGEDFGLKAGEAARTLSNEMATYL